MADVVKPPRPILQFSVQIIQSKKAYTFRLKSLKIWLNVRTNVSPSVLVSTAHALMEVSAQVLFDDAASMNYFPIADFCVCANHR